MNSKFKDLEHKLVHLESKILPPPAAAYAAGVLSPLAMPLRIRARHGIVVTLSIGAWGKLKYIILQPDHNIHIYCAVLPLPGPCTVYTLIK